MEVWLFLYFCSSSEAIVGQDTIGERRKNKTDMRHRFVAGWIIKEVIVSAHEEELWYPNLWLLVNTLLLPYQSDHSFCYKSKSFRHWLIPILSIFPLLMTLWNGTDGRNGWISSIIYFVNHPIIYVYWVSERIIEEDLWYRLTVSWIALTRT